MRQYTAGSLLATHRWASEHPDGVIPIDRFESLTGREWLLWFHDCLHQKASRGTIRAGRKWTRDWFCQAVRTAREVNTPRLVIRWIPFEFRARLTHRLFRGDA